MMSRLSLLPILLLFFLHVSIIQMPLHAMDDEKEFGTSFIQSRSYQQSPPELDVYESLATSFAKLAFGTMLIYTCPFNDLNETPWHKTIGSMIGVQLIQKSLYELGSGLYERWRQKSIQREMGKLEQEKDNFIKHKKKSGKKKDNALRKLNDEISHLSNINPQEEFVYYTNYLNCASTILQTMFIGWRMTELLCQNTAYTFFPRKSYTVKAKNINELKKNFTALNEYLKYIQDETKPHISLIGTSATLVDSVWSLCNLYKYWNGGALGQDTPLKCLISTLSCLNGSVLYHDKVVQGFSISNTGALHSAIKKGYIKTKPPINSTMTAENFFTAMQNGHIKLLLYDNRARNYCIEYMKNYAYYSEKIYVACGYAVHLNLGNACKYFWKNCATLYQERKRWFARIDKLAGDPSEPRALPIDEPKTSLQQTYCRNKNTLEYQTVVFPSLEVVSQISLEAPEHERIPSPSAEVSNSKSLKQKTRGNADKHKQSEYKESKKLTKIVNLPTVTENFSSMEERDNLRRIMLEKIQDIRLKNSEKRTYIETILGHALKFVGGNAVIDGNAYKIHWKRGAMDRSVTFERTHNQRGEKSSVMKGYKLTKALDAIEQIYLDGWDRKNIQDHLKGRFSLYNLPFDLLHILWSSPEELRIKDSKKKNKKK